MKYEDKEKKKLFDEIFKLINNLADFEFDKNNETEFEELINKANKIRKNKFYDVPKNLK
jgi:hypothetical protein